MQNLISEWKGWLHKYSNQQSGVWEASRHLYQERKIVMITKSMGIDKILWKYMCYKEFIKNTSTVFKWVPKKWLLRWIAIYDTKVTMMLLFLFKMFVWPTINIMNMFIICHCDWSICCCIASSWQHRSLSFFISSWWIAKSCCICIPIMLIILSGKDSSPNLIFLCFCKDCLGKA